MEALKSRVSSKVASVSSRLCFKEGVCFQWRLVLVRGSRVPFLFAFMSNFKPINYYPSNFDRFQREGFQIFFQIRNFYPLSRSNFEPEIFKSRKKFKRSYRSDEIIHPRFVISGEHYHWLEMGYYDVQLRCLAFVRAIFEQCVPRPES